MCLNRETGVTISVRAAAAADLAFITGVVPRLRAFGPPPLRPAEALDRAERETLRRALAEPSPDAVLLVAELAGTGPAGVAYAHTAADYFTGERHGHLSVLAVAEAGEGKGVGRALLAAVEAWSSARGHRFITLNVFAGNGRARAVYERAGYGPDTLRYAKELPAAPAPAGGPSSG
jgi:GNAT superfamily N-acetyltransferase